MSNDRIRQFREAKGWTQAQLAAAVGLDTTAISKLENGKKRLRTDELQRIAAALDVDVPTMLGGERQPSAQRAGMSDEATPYVAGAGDPFSALEHGNRHLYTARCKSLTAAGISPGDVLVIDGSADAVRAIRPLAIVMAQHHPDRQQPGHAATILRQFVPPALLITNSRDANEMPLEIGRDDVQILGVVVSIHRALQS